MPERAERRRIDLRMRGVAGLRIAARVRALMRAWPMVLLALAADAAADSGDRTAVTRGPWRLSLSWSPQFCHAAPEFSQEIQCSTALGFAPAEIVELPASADGDCTRAREVLPPDQLVRFQELLRNRRWGKIQATRRYPCGQAFGVENILAGEYLYGTLRFPTFDTAGQRADEANTDDFVRGFRELNGWPDSVTITPTCDRGWLRSVVICADSALRFQTCEDPAVPRCPSTFKVRPPRADLARSR